MKKFMQQPGSIVDDMLLGAVCASRGLAILDQQRVVIRSDFEGLKRSNQVALISGGGAGHEPAHAGYVGPGLLTAAVCGEVFTSPSTDAVLSAIRTVGGAAGVLLIVKNYTGDRLNFGLAAEIARSEGIRVEMLVVADDASISDEAVTAGKRGIAGTVLIHKIAGAAAAEGKTLEQVLEISSRAAGRLSTMGVALSSCTVPAAGRPSFSLGEDEIEFGLGIHGEPGVERTKIAPVDEIVSRILSAIVPPSAHTSEPVALLVNNLGGTSAMEISVVANEVLRQARRRALPVKRIWFGTFLTALEMAGASISALRLDAELLRYLDAPADAFAWPGPGVEPRYEVLVDEVKPVSKAKAEAAPLGIYSAAMKNVVLAVAKKLIQSEALLTELDRKVGDGDLGINLARGGKIISENISQLEGQDVASALRWLSALVRANVGGTSGALYAIGLMRAASSVEHARSGKADAFRHALRAAAEGIAEMGGAKLGDRTMLDALIPAAEAFESGGVRQAIAAARAGAERSSQISSRKGRSSYIGDRVIGHSDPGAEAVVLWLEAIDEAMSPGQASGVADCGASIAR